MSRIKSTIFIFIIALCSQVFCEWIDITNYYGNDTIYKELKSNWPSFTYTAGKSDGKLDVKYLFDGKLQIFPSGPLRAWLVAFKGSKELCIYHFINNDGSNVKQRARNSTLSAGQKKSRRKNNKGAKFPIEKGVNSLLPPYGIERFDIIVGANGKLFEMPHPSNNQGGEYGPIYDLAMAIEKGQSAGKISLMIKKPGDAKDKPPRKVTVKIEKLPPFSKTYPARCRRSKMIENEIMEVLADDSKSPKLSNNISWPMVGLAMLASGNKKYLPAIEEYAMRLNDHFTRGDSSPSKIVTVHQGSSWKSGFTLVFLAEYFWATGDMRVFPTIQRLAYDVDEYHMHAIGGAGHGAHGRGTYWDISFGPPNGLNDFGAGLAERVGAKINPQLYEKYWNIMTQTHKTNIKNGTTDYTFEVKDDKDYYTCYGHVTFERELRKSLGPLQCINTSTAALALMFNRYKNPQVKRLAQKLHDNMIYTYKIHPYVHTTPVMGQFFSQLALNANDNARELNSRVVATFNEPYAKIYAGDAVMRKGSKEPVAMKSVKKLTSHEAWRKIMDYRKYQLIHSRLDPKTYFYFIPRLQNSGGWGGDGYANLQGSALYNLLNLVVSHNRDLLMYGGRLRNWMVANNKKHADALTKVTLSKIKAYHNLYSEHLVKFSNFLHNGGKDKSKVGKKTRESKELARTYKLLAYEYAEKVAKNYRGYPAQKSAMSLMGKIVKELGGRKRVAMYLNNLEAMRIIDYACVLHERVNTKNWMDMRKKIMKWVQMKYPNCPAAKMAAKEYDKTVKMEAAMGSYDKLEIDKSSELYTERRIPEVDLNQM